MGSQYSSRRSHLRRRDTKKINHQKEAQKDDPDENKSPRKHVFIWKIHGFASLLERGEGSTISSFKMVGINWYLSINPMDKKSGDTGSEKHMSLGLAAALVSLSLNYMLETKFKIFIYNQLDGKHIEREVSHTYLSISHRSEVSCMIPLETLKSPSLGFLVDDSIAVGVEFIEFKKVPCTGVERISFISNEKSSGSCSWYIEDFFQLSRPAGYTFQIAGYTWTLELEPESVLCKNYVALYLKLVDESGSHLPRSSDVMVDAVLSIKRQSKGVIANDPLGTGTLDPYQKRIRNNFTRNSRWGYPQLIKLEDFKNPSNGYLVNGTCTIEASICVFGFGNNCSY